MKNTNDYNGLKKPQLSGAQMLAHGAKAFRPTIGRQTAYRLNRLRPMRGTSATDLPQSPPPSITNGSASSTVSSRLQPVVEKMRNLALRIVNTDGASISKKPQPGRQMSGYTLDNHDNNIRAAAQEATR